MNKLEAIDYIKKQNSKTDIQKIIDTHYDNLIKESYDIDELKKEIKDTYIKINDNVISVEQFEEMYLYMILNITRFDNLEIQPNNLLRDYSKMIEIANKFSNNLDDIPKPPAFHYEVMIGMYGQDNAKIVMDSISKLMFDEPLRINRNNNFAKEWKSLINKIKGF